MENKELVVLAGEDVYWQVAAFEHAQRLAKLFAASKMVPEHFQNDIGACLIALNFAHRVGMDPFAVMQKRKHLVIFWKAQWFL